MYNHIAYLNLNISALQMSIENSRKMDMRCQVCGKVPTGIKICGKCGTGFYCGGECQTADWSTHKIICGLWIEPISESTSAKSTVSPKVLNNPWYSTVDTKPDVDVRLQLDDKHPLLIACVSGEMREDIIAGSSHIAIPIGTHMESPLHVAVMGGNIEAVSLLLQYGAYINAEDSFGNTPLYYACSHPGFSDAEIDVLNVDGVNTEGDVPNADNVNIKHASTTTLPPEVRLEIVKILVKNGADTMQLSQITEMRPAETAMANGHNEVAKYIINSAEYKRFRTLRAQINDASTKSKFVKMFVDNTWRVFTLQWYLNPVSGKNVRAHPQLKIRNIDDIEMIMRDCARRHKWWWERLMAV